MRLTFTRLIRLTQLAIVWLATHPSPAAEPPPADQALDRYFRAETATLTTRSAFQNAPPAELRARAETDRTRLQDMLGLLPMPERTPLNPVLTGRLEAPGVIVEKLHFQSSPGLYVTANLYRPATQTTPLPAILYVCGHARVFTNGVSCGNKTAYQHHGIWFARHGYVCLLIDTLQLGEIEGHHHGTYRLGQWWWNSRGYTPAGVEAWNGIRALDYLASRPEVDPARLGVTGRSGGGSYSWTIAALDDRVRAAAPVAGITDLRNHVVDGTVEGHCDCMFFVNTFRWDFPRHAALLAPRPLLIVNTDADGIFPLDGVQRLHADTREVYAAHRATDRLGLVIGPGDHKDTQDLQVPVFRWFNQHLRNEDPLIEDAAVRLFSPLDLRVFDQLPADQRNTTAAEWFGPNTTPSSRTSISGQSPDTVRTRLRERTFAGWPDATPGPEIILRGEQKSGELRLGSWSFQSQPHVPLEFHLLTRGPRPPERIIIHALDHEGWAKRAPHFRNPNPDALAPELEENTAVAWIAPRGIGPGAWSGDDRKQIQIRRRFMLLGQTVDGMRVWDLINAVHAIRQGRFRDLPVDLRASGPMAVNALLASMHVDRVRELHLASLPDSFLSGPDYLNVLQVLDIPDALAWIRERGVRVVTE